MQKFNSFKILVLIFCLSANFIYAQFSSYKIVEKVNGMVLNLSFIKQPYNVEGEKGGVINYFNAVDESKPGAPILPSKTIIIAIPPESKILITVTDKRFEKIKSVVPKSNPLVELGVDSNLIYKDTRLSSKYSLSDAYPEEEINIEGYTWIRDYYCAIIRINTHRYYWKKREIDELLSANIKVDFIEVKQYTINRNSTGLFDSNLDNLILNIKNASEFRSFRSNFSPMDSTGNWIDFGAEYLKLGVSSDGIYRIIKSDLENFNIVTSSINPLTFKIFHKGNEIPIFVSGEEDGSLNDEDFIEFFGTMNYGSTEYRVANGINDPYTEYIDRYTDTTIYWLTWDGDLGSRIDTSSFIGTSFQDTVTYYTEISHYENNGFLDYFVKNIVEKENPEWIRNETWFWGGQGVGTSNRNFSISQFVSNDSAEVYFRALSWASDKFGDEDAHNLGISINSDPAVYDSGYIDKYSQKVLKAKFPTNLLQNGNNILKTISFPVPNSDINMIVRDWYEVEYPRYIHLFDDSLKIRFEQYLVKKLYGVRVQNTSESNQYIIYKISGIEKRIEHYLQNSNELFFLDSVQAGDSYYITADGKIRKPKIYYKKQFQNLRDSNIQADYLLITHPYFEEEAADYINFISNNYEVTTKLVNVLDIYDQFNFGLFKPESIKDFLSLANQYWTDPKPSYVFLVGDANYDYHNYRLLEDYTPNYVPSFGHPVSDNWFAIWDSVFTIPQMFVGRLPVKTVDELSHYLYKHSKYLLDPFNIWNKSYFLMSGGSNESEKSVAKGVNDNLRTNYINPEPTGGYTGQLYATENPRTNFGPFTQDYIDSVFNNGGIIVSYIGHSGTKIWDNGIENVDQIKNKYNKFPLINDFGCSTVKFAEPDITSFSESFTNGLDGEAIAYLGNSSLGFTSTSYNYPKLFFEQVLKNGIFNISRAHNTAKQKLIQNFGIGDLYRLFVLTNTLIGDPLISLKIPEKPNLNVTASDIKIPSFLDDNLDSISIKINYRNLGHVDSSFFNIKIDDYVNNQLVFTDIIRDGLPLNDRIKMVGIPVKKRPGEHTMIVTLDTNNEIEEIYDNDNSALVKYIVLTSSIRAIIADTTKLISNGTIRFLNSVRTPSENSILVRLSSSPNFTDEVTYQKEFDTLKTEVEFENLLDDTRYWYKTSFISTPETVFETNSFVYDASENFNFAFIDSVSTKDFTFSNSNYSNGSIHLGDDEIPLIINSAGFEAGGPAKITLDNIDYAENAQGCGHHIVVIDEATMQFEEYRWFNYWNDPNNYEAYVNYLNTIEPDKLVAISIGAECGGFSPSQELIDKLHEFGSSYIDSVGWATSWFLLGKLGSPVGSVPEGFSRTEPIYYDSIFVRTNLAGSFSTNKIVNSARWDSLFVSVDSLSTSSQIKIKPIVNTTTPDTLNEIFIENGKANLEFLNIYKNKGISILVELAADEQGNSPLVNSIKIKYDLVPELGTNYQVVTSTADTVTIGEEVGLNFFVYNVGESTADSFKVKVEIINDDNSRNTIFEQIVDSLGSEQRKHFEINYNTSSSTGAKTFLINIDSDKQITELYEDNNFYIVPFFIKQDTTRPTLKISFDGNDILDGDYISPKPEIKIEMSDESLLPITDTSAVTIFLNDVPVYYVNNQTLLSIEFNEENPKAVVTYTPELEDGEYYLKIFGQNSLGNIADSSGFEKHFLISNEAKLLYVYNYPNPTSGETHFTFKLTQIPDEMKIKIYTIAGRLIKEIKIPAVDLSYDFNKIYWDGRDEDGDIIANGVYLYKVILTAGDKTEDVIQKLAIVR
jgi:hypothetical protein